MALPVLKEKENRLDPCEAQIVMIALLSTPKRESQSWRESGNIPMLIRKVQVRDAEQLLGLQHQLDQETEFMLLEPGERKTTVEEKRQQIEQVLAGDISTIFVAEHEEQLVAYLDATGYTLKRMQHTLTLVIGILQAFTGQGIGTQLFIAMEEWAREKQLHRLELTVMTNNKAGIALYKKRGFEIEGVRKHAYVVHGEYVDEYHMAKLLG